MRFVRSGIALLIFIFLLMNKNYLSLDFALLIEIVMSVPICFYVFKPLSNIFSKNKSSLIFYNLLAFRSLLLIYITSFVTVDIAIYDLLLFAFGEILLVPFCNTLFGHKSIGVRIDNRLFRNTTYEACIEKEKDYMEVECINCGYKVNYNLNKCINCGESIDVDVLENKKNKKMTLTPFSFDRMYRLKSDEELLEAFILDEINNQDVFFNGKYLPANILKRNNILSYMFSILLFFMIFLIFFHLPIYVYAFIGVILYILNRLTKSFSMMDYLKKEIKARPQEKIVTIIASVKNSMVLDRQKGIRILSLVVAMLLPLIIFINPKIMYEKVDGGYSVRYYTFGLTGFSNINIPDTYKGEKVVSLNNKVFANMPFLKQVILPDTIMELDGEIFKNDFSLEGVKLPKELLYIGDRTFYNCSSLKSIVIPDTVFYIGKEAFFSNKSLEVIVLPKSLMKIKESTFENCVLLKNVTIPNNVEVIEKKAFKGNIELSKVNIASGSKLEKIEDLAFAGCTDLKNIRFPENVKVHKKAFIDSSPIIDYYYNEVG